MTPKDSLRSTGKLDQRHAEIRDVVDRLLAMEPPAASAASDAWLELSDHIIDAVLEFCPGPIGPEDTVAAMAIAAELLRRGLAGRES